MQIKTKEKKIVEVVEKQIYDFPNGIFGFEQFHRYALIDSDYEPFIWLQSIDKEDLAFLLVDPFLICNEYEADIDDAALNEIGVKSPEDIILMTIVTIPQNDEVISANFLGPIVINRKNNKCMQIVLNDTKWTTKFDIIKALKNKGE